MGFCEGLLFGLLGVLGIVSLVRLVVVRCFRACCCCLWYCDGLGFWIVIGGLVIVCAFRFGWVCVLDGL